MVFRNSLGPMTWGIGPWRFCTGSNKVGLAPGRESEADKQDKAGDYELSMAAFKDSEGNLMALMCESGQM